MHLKINHRVKPLYLATLMTCFFFRNSTFQCSRNYNAMSYFTTNNRYYIIILISQELLEMNKLFSGETRRTTLSTRYLGLILPISDLSPLTPSEKINFYKGVVPPLPSFITTVHINYN